MRDITTIAVQAVAVSVDPVLEDAHRAAAEFHEAMADAIEAKEDIDGPDGVYWRSRYVAAMGRAAAALQKMPVQWAAVLNAKV